MIDSILMFLDLNMPVLNGIETFLHIKENQGDYSFKINVIIVTADQNDFDYNYFVS